MTFSSVDGGRIMNILSNLISSVARYRRIASFLKALSIARWCN